MPTAQSPLRASCPSLHTQPAHVMCRLLETYERHGLSFLDLFHHSCCKWEGPTAWTAVMSRYASRKFRDSYESQFGCASCVLIADSPVSRTDGAALLSNPYYSSFLDTPCDRSHCHGSSSRYRSNISGSF